MVTTVLRERMRQAMRIRNLSARTEQIYLHSVARFAQHFRRSPDRLGLGDIEQYLLHLRDEKRVSWPPPGAVRSIQSPRVGAASSN